MTIPNHSPLARFLARILRHSRLTSEEQQAILGLRSHAAQFAARRDIVTPGQLVDHACLIVKGLAARFDLMRDGRRQVTALHIPGDMCDLHSVVQPRTAWSITSMTATTVLHVPHVDLRQIAIHYPAIAMAFWRDTAADAAVLAKWVGNLGRKDAQARLAHLFCEIGYRMELIGMGSRQCFNLPLTQEQLADVTGLTAVHVNRTLQALRESGALSFQAGVAQIHDMDRIVALGEFDPNYLRLQAEPNSSSRELRPTSVGAQIGRS